MEITSPARSRAPRRLGLRLRIGAVALVVAMAATGCWTYTSDQNTVVSGNLMYFFYKKKATDQVVDLLHYSVNGGNERTTLSGMYGWAKSAYIKNRILAYLDAISDFNFFFDPENDDDFEGAAADSHNNSRCLVMHRNANPFGDRHNWTTRPDADRYCVNGKGYV